MKKLLLNETIKQEKVFELIGILTIYIAIYFAVVISVATSFFETFELQNLNDFFNFNQGALYLTIHDLIALPIYFLMIYLMHKKSLFKVSQFVKATNKTMALCLLLGISMGTWVMSFLQIPLIKNSYPQFDELFDFLITGNVVFIILFIALHSVYKEIFFRGMVFNQLRSVLSLPLAIFVNGLIYGYLFFYWDIMLTIYGMLGAIIFNLVYIWYESIWATITIEFSLFTSYFIFREMNYEFSWISISLNVISSIVLLGTMYILWKQRKTVLSKNQVKGETVLHL
ncbi:CPBP family intramembrane glutamic endopeptidase [Chengkuizengella sediminis]|uniref:CPBP family intramembrane glutamic endopeptidase n=1 Tax=Chengkuizengella sediminis TaxID=1885917 RepID=UPI00138A62BC|nr:type II CAAX endopeptidase family protein [Chengkuizengella sediminis]NDI34046.1 CPBP family intramembrane metalloprotease [Chengkuizengella sediminis]